MTPIIDGKPLPAGLELDRTSFYSRNGIVTNVAVGESNGKTFVVFDWDTNSGEVAETFTVIGVKVSSPKSPQTWLSRSSGLQLERAGNWVVAFQPGNRVGSNEIVRAVADVLNLLDYATAFPQNV